jgi:hypothetical protein
MGSWGYKPYENDDAGGFFCTLTEADDAVRVITKALKRGSEDGEARAAAHTLAIIRKYVARPYLYLQDINKSIQRLELLLNDDEYLNDWNDPADAKKAIQKELRALKRCKR